jgi:hypothetical protein
MLAVPSLLSDPRFHNRRCGVDLTTVLPAPRSPPKVLKIPCSARSTAHASVAQCPSERPVRFVVAPLGLLGCGCLEGGVAQYTWGSCNRATRGHSRCPVPQARSPNAFYRSTANFVKHWCNQRFGVVLMVDLPPRAQRCWRALHDSAGSTTARGRRDAVVRTRAPSGNARVAAM